MEKVPPLSEIVAVSVGFKVSLPVKVMVLLTVIVTADRDKVSKLLLWVWLTLRLGPIDSDNERVLDIEAVPSVTDREGPVSVKDTLPSVREMVG